MCLMKASDPVKAAAPNGSVRNGNSTECCEFGAREPFKGVEIYVVKDLDEVVLIV